ncbi:MAG: hypothetical protein WCI04_07360 [archaeon]
MEEENKVEESKIEEVKVEEKTECKNGLGCLKSGFKCCKGRACKCGKGKWLALAIIVLVLAATGSYYYKLKKADIGVEGAKAKVEQFIKENTQNAGAGISVKDVVKESGMYKVTVDANKQEIISYVTADGSKFFPQVVDLNKKADASASNAPATPQKTEAEVKAEIPTVDLFVMSYCPYGLQMERGVLPAVEALGKKIKFNLKFVDYTLHGPKEVTENVNQYCIQKTQPTKLNAYLKCFWKSSTGTSETCVKTVGINAAQLATCVTATNKEFNPTEKAMGLNKDETVKFGVQGSPTLVINGTTVSSGRDSASVLKAICSGFTTQPKECQVALSATAPGAGFDDQVSASASGSAPAAACATPPAN